MKYSFWKGLGKILVEGVIWLGPLAVQILPDTVGNLTISAALRLMLNYVKVRSLGGLSD